MKYLFFLFFIILIRYGKANNLGVENYDNDEEDEHLIYLDANNLYGWAMSQHLPSNDFKWMSPEDIDGIDFADVSDDSERGYILEVDLGNSSFLL